MRIGDSKLPAPKAVETSDQRIQELVEAMYCQLGFVERAGRPALLTEQQVAAVLHLAVPTLRSRRCRGDAVPSHSVIGRHVSYAPADVAAFIHACTERAPK